MSLVIAVPELMTEAATDLQNIGATLNAAHVTAAAPTLEVLPAAADEVSASVAHLFSGYGQDYQKLAGRAAVFHEQFVQHLKASADMYASAEAVNIGLVQPLTPMVESIIAASGLQEPLANALVKYLATLQQVLLGNPLTYSLGGALAIGLIFAFVATVLFFLLAGSLLSSIDFSAIRPILLPIVSLLGAVILPTSDAITAIA